MSIFLLVNLFNVILVPVVVAVGFEDFMTVFPAHDSLSTSFILLVLNTGMTTGSHPNDLAKLQITIDSWNKALFRLPCMMLLEDVDKQFGTKNSVIQSY